MANLLPFLTQAPALLKKRLPLQPQNGLPLGNDLDGYTNNQDPQNPGQAVHEFGQLLSGIIPQAQPPDNSGTLNGTVTAGQPPPVSNYFGNGLTDDPSAANQLGNGLTTDAIEPPSPFLPQAQPAQRLSQQLGDEQNAILSKDYSKARPAQYDEQGNLVSPAKARGKDRDKKWSFMDKVGSALLGFAQGGIPGAIQAGTDRNFMEKQGDARQLSKLLPQIEAARGQEKADQAYTGAEIQQQNVLADNARLTGDLNRKTNKDNRDYDIKTRALDWKKEDRERYYELEDVKLSAKARNDQKTWEAADRKQAEIERHNGVTEKQAATNEGGRNSRSRYAQGEQTNRVKMSLQGKSDDQKRQLVVTSLDKWKAQNKFATPEDIAAAQRNIEGVVYNQ